MATSIENSNSIQNSDLNTNNESESSSSQCDNNGFQKINDHHLNSNTTTTNNILVWKRRFYTRIKNNLWILGFLGSLSIPLLCGLSYALTWQKGHYHPIFPYVSDSASFLPAANYFSQLLDMIAIIFTITIWARYKQFKYYLTRLLPNSTNKHINNPYKLRLLHQMNFYFLIFGLIAPFGLVLIGNFRIVENMTGHMFGVTVLFGFIPIIMLIQIYLIEQLYRCDRIESRAISLMIITSFNIISTFTSSLTALIAVLYHGSPFKYWDNNFRLYWSSDMDGYEWHLASTIAEWAAIISFAPLLFSTSQRLRLFQHWDQVSF
ncbi:DNA damage-regulated autophagy modulator protein 2 [Dermatophagoides farinae]|uniref:DNA damage-regulated autophagy modulator protein n=1 Tax=Dermatophagoides farinae TaxID=6954 RepID=A0A922KZL0_DERFA|nr:DNA damage-regulated autophagy modulator protein 2-like [Dermatophagoides farinae]KAH7644073.1 hypothetical protein HUG17_6435 [Dermatophagoides farinae]KAH9494114.1 DNA damage-regulated autophagy modulator protein [Dermatophagoides farinae]